MSFYWPHAFWFLTVPMLLALLEARQRGAKADARRPKILRAEAGPHSLSLTSAAITEKGRSRVRWRLMLGLTLAVIAIARPQWGRIEEPVFDQSREIIIAVDLSRSMLADDVKPTRLERAKLLITSLLERLAGERVGMIVFSGTAFLQSPLSADYEILREFLPTLGPDYLPEGGTDYRSLLETAVGAFGASNSADRYLVILSDGEAQTDDWKPLIQTLKEKGIRVLGLGIGTSTGAMLPDGSGGFIKDERGAVVLSKLESGTLQALAQATSGVYTDASSWVDLPELIKTTVETGKKGEFREENRVRLGERFQWALAPAMLFLAWSFWREVPVRPRVRDVKLTDLRPQKDGAAPPSAVAANVALFALGLGAIGLLGFAPQSRADDAPSIPAEQPLSKLVSQFAARDNLVARDYAEMARSTVTYGERQTSSQGKVAEGAIKDGLSAVDAGEALDKKAADWPALRKDLERFLEPPKDQKPPPQQQPPKDDSQKDKKDDSDQKQENPSDKSDKADKSKSDSSKPSPDKDKKNDQKDASNSEDKKKEEQKDGSKAQSAFGEMKDEKADKKPGEPRPEDFQKVGGAPEKKSEAPPTDPALAIPLQKLDQLRNQDSPARLYQLMQDQPPTPAKKGKDW